MIIRLLKLKIKPYLTPKGIALFMLCLNSVFVFLNPDPYLGIADYFVFFVLYIAISFFNKGRLTLGKPGLFFIVLCACVIAAAFIAASRGVFSSGYILSYLLYFTLAIVMLGQKYTEKEIRQLLHAYIFSALVITLILFLQRYDFYGSGNTRHTIHVMSNEAFDPNFLAAYLVVPAVISFFGMLRRFHWLYLASFLLITAGIFYTSSRGAMLSEVIGLGIIVLDFFKGKKKIRRIAAVVLLLAVGFLLAREFIPSTSLSRLFNFKTYKDSSNAKRLLDWKYGLMAFAKRPLFGYGMQGELGIIQSAIGVDYISHNTFIAFLLQFGCMGCLLFLAGLWTLYRRIRHNALLLACLLATLSASFLVSAEVAIFFWLPIIYISVISCVGSGEIEQKDRFDPVEKTIGEEIC